MPTLAIDSSLIPNSKEVIPLVIAITCDNESLPRTSDKK